MSRVAEVGAIALQGIDGARICVEAGVTRQLPGLAIVGLPDTALAEAKQRVRHAATAMGLQLSDRFVLVNLRPADLPKQGSGFDLAIALAVLAVSGECTPTHLHATAHIGELSLDGTVRRPRGLLSAVLAARAEGFTSVMVPLEGFFEACLVPEVRVIGVESLRGAVNWYHSVVGGWQVRNIGDTGQATVQEDEPDPVSENHDFVDVLGQQAAIEALTIAAAGRHHIQMMGPPGVGKTMLASRLPSILPQLSDAQALNVNSIRSLISQQPLTHLVRIPPFQQPHHTASVASVVGAGRGGLVLPGTLSLASHGIMFMDEAPEFDRRVLDALRQPLEQGMIDIHRVGMRVRLPADVQLVLAQNPCPCGKAGVTFDDSSCVCTPMQRRRYASKISGPLKDRLDICISLRRVSSVASSLPNDEPVSSAQLRHTVIEARDAANERLSGTPWSVNAEVPGAWLRSHTMRLGRSTTHIIDRALELGTLSLRGYDRVLRVAWSISDLRGSTIPDASDISRALMLRGDS